MLKQFIYLTLLVALVVLLQGCPLFVCDPERIEYPPLSDSLRCMIPYQNAESYQFQHSAGHIITFECERKTDTIRDCYSCSKCFISEEDVTTLKPNYPINEVRMVLRTGPMENEYEIHFVFGRNYFDIYPIENGFTPHDSLNIGGNIYYNVYAMANYNHAGYYGLQHQLFADSLYYNHDKGIIRITMSNDEYYQRYED